MSAVAARPDRRQAEEFLSPVDPVRLFFVVDSAHDAGSAPKLRAWVNNGAAVSLYDGDAAERLDGVAPYLLRLNDDPAMFDWIWQSVWGRWFGVFVWAESPLADLRAHLRRLTKVRTEDGRILLFRFYDPRVLSVFLPSCDEEQARFFFGPARRFFAEGAGGETLAAYDLRNGRVETETRRLAAAS
jgi:hypothetical protein